MEITNAPLAWTETDERHWSSFLDTETGKRLIPKLLEATPVLLGDGSRNAILIRNGEVRGMQIAVTTLLALSHAQERLATPQLAYPPPEDDSHWDDGQKLTPAQPE